MDSPIQATAAITCSQRSSRLPYSSKYACIEVSYRLLTGYEIERSGSDNRSTAAIRGPGPGSHDQGDVVVGVGVGDAEADADLVDEARLGQGAAVGCEVVAGVEHQREYAGCHG